MLLSAINVPEKRMLRFQHFKKKLIAIRGRARRGYLLCGCAHRAAAVVSFRSLCATWEPVFKKIWDSTEANKFRQTLALAPHSAAFFLVTFVLIRGSLCKYLSH